ncbi:glycerol kinase [Frankliniella occidentalis]|uniref:Probable glycerol kinase n=1 Tax=Frankliniella occidentalis TaxID=133901 RepID=A0A6J1T4U2_FRAOC|nr:glycerol kinase [Frankliniella occidentalis]
MPSMPSSDAANMPVAISRTSVPQGPLIGALEEGTRTCRFALYEASTLREVAVHCVEVESLRPEEGWVEQDPVAILRAARECMAAAVAALPPGLGARDVAAVGVTNQRETTVVWDKVTGQPLHHALVWNDIRTSKTVDAVLARMPGNDKDALRALAGVPVSPYFSALKLRWLIDNVPAVSKAIQDKRCLFGTVDSWLVWNLTGGPRGGLHITDVTNASRTLLMNIHSLQWDPQLLRTFDIPAEILPEIRSSSEVYGDLSEGPLRGVPISAILGNQQAALVGERCFKEGQAKSTYRSGCFLLYNTGAQCVQSKHGLLSTVAYKMGPDAPTVYALEGSVAVAGHAIKWLRDNLNLLKDPADCERLAAEVASTGDVYFVPAFTGLYAPHWRKDARGILCGLTQFTTKGHIIRASLEAVCFQTRDILEAMARDCGKNSSETLTELRVDGKMAVNNLLLQLQADLCGSSVVRTDVTEKAAVGAAIAAGQARGVDLVKLDALPPPQSQGDVFTPSISQEDRKARYTKWKMALTRSLGWAKPPKSASMTDKRYHLLASIPPSLFFISSFAMMLVSEL